MIIDFKEMENEGETLYAPTIDGKDTSCYFGNKSEAIIYAGLLESGIGLNDSSYLSRYISVMLRGLKQESLNDK